MSFRPNVHGPLLPMGAITIAAPGTGSPFDVNWDPQFRPSTSPSPSDNSQYTVSLEDIIISSQSTNTGGVFVVAISAGGAFTKTVPESILLYIPKGSPPISLAGYLGKNRFQPGLIGIDVEQADDTVWAVGLA